MGNDDSQGRLPFAAIEAHHRENLDLLRRLAGALGLPGKARDLLVWTANHEYRWSAPLRVTYHQIGEKERGLSCSRATAARVVSRLREHGLLAVVSVVTPSGQRPNEYRVDWDSVTRVWREVSSSGDFGEPLRNQNPAPQNETPRVSKCAAPSLILTPPAPQNETHIKEIHVLKTQEEIHTYRTACAESQRGSARLASVREEFFLPEGEWPIVREGANGILRVLGRPQPGKEGEDRVLAFKVAWLSHLDELPEAVTADALAVVKSGYLKGEKIRNNAAAYRGVLVQRCKQLEVDLHRLLLRVPIPDWAEKIFQGITQTKDVVAP